VNLPGELLYYYTLLNYEPDVTNAFLSHIQPEDIVIDLGADVRQVGNVGGVYAFEADPDNFKILTDNIAINSFTNVKPCGKLCRIEQAKPICTKKAA
jgi:predicted RNA methylase